MKLTKAAIDRLPTPERGKQAFYWDSSLPCFGVRVTPHHQKLYYPLLSGF